MSYLFGFIGYYYSFNYSDMPLENQVTSLKLSKRLKSLGAKQDSLFFWTDKGLMSDEWIIESGVGVKIASAFTSVELGDMLKVSGKSFPLWSQARKEWYWLDMTSKTEANIRAKTLIYLIENKLIK